MHQLKRVLGQNLQVGGKTLGRVFTPAQINTFLTGYLVKKAWQDKGYITPAEPIPSAFSSSNDNHLFWRDWEELNAQAEPFLGDTFRDFSLTAVPVEEIISLYLQLQPLGRRQRLGVYYTPPEVVDFILAHSLLPLLRKLDPSQVTFLDPSCGCGFFLSRAYDGLRAAYLRRGVPQGEVPALILRHNLYGVDIDPWALQLSALLLLEKDREVWQAAGRLPTQNLFWGDALDKNGPLSTVFDRPFSVVGGNPPHVTNYARRSQGLKQEYIDTLKPQYQFSRGRRSNRYNLTMFFLERFLELLEVGGRAGVVVDGSGFQTTVYKEIREYIQSQSLVEHIVSDLEIFPGVNNRQAIFILKKPPKGRGVPKHGIRFQRGLSGETIEIPQNSSPAGWLRPVPKEVASLLAKIKAAGPPLGELYRAISGMNVTNRPGAGLKPFLSAEPLDSSYHKAIFSSNISPYIVRWPTGEQIAGRGRKRKYICYDRELARAINNYLAGQGLKARVSIGKSDVRFRREKIFVRQSLDASRRIAAAYSDDPEEYCDNSAYVINALFSHYSLFYLLPLLNSGLMTFYAREAGILSAASRATATRLPMGSSRGPGLRDLPVPAISPDEQKPLINLAQELINLGQRMVGAEDKGEAAAVVAILRREMGILLEKVEERVYALYNLNPREVNLLRRRDKDAGKKG